MDVQLLLHHLPCELSIRIPAQSAGDVVIGSTHGSLRLKLHRSRNIGLARIKSKAIRLQLLTDSSASHLEPCKPLDAATMHPSLSDSAGCLKLLPFHMPGHARIPEHLW